MRPAVVTRRFGRRGLGVLLSLLPAATFPGAARGIPLPVPAGGHLELDVRTLGYGRWNDPAVSELNPDNSVLLISRYEAHLDLRPDLKLQYPTLLATARPRLDLAYREWQSGGTTSSDSEDEAYLNEAWGRWSFRDRLFLYGGRENLQWGPAFLLSLSNPFNPSNGRDNPVGELPGMDFTRAVWVPNPTWTLSLIALLDEGRYESLAFGEEFNRVYAAKLDATGRGRYAGLIASVKEEQAGDPTIGGFAGMNVGEAVLLYTEGNIPPDADAFQALVGGSYTFTWSGILSLEYFHNAGGLRTGNRVVPLPEPEPGAESVVPPPATASSAQFFRKNYLLLQYYDSFRDRTEITIRWTHAVDDESNRLTGILWHALNDYLTSFAMAHAEDGRPGATFGGVMDYSLTAGLSLTF